MLYYNKIDASEGSNNINKTSNLREGVIYLVRTQNFPKN